ncbi:hypothetical protein ACIQ9P_22475 [Kitasatospora sp. NPDC094019]|uniref:hypothetical protein n=1 Tax=Kitasatospora sp. NPDC094019 TaxID=3364091 RepID=UPI003814AFEE
MAETVKAPDARPDADEVTAARAVAPGIPDTAEPRFVVLRPPSGGRGGGTSDIAVYKNIPAEDIDRAAPGAIPTLKRGWDRNPDAEQLGTLDVYTPLVEDAQAVVDRIRDKADQASGVCVNSARLNDRTFAALRARCAAERWGSQFVVLVRKGATVDPVYGNKPPYWHR